MIGYLADLKLGARAAERAKVGDTPEFRRRLAYYRLKVLMDEFIAREPRRPSRPTPPASSTTRRWRR